VIELSYLKMVKLKKTYRRTNGEQHKECKIGEEMKLLIVEDDTILRDGLSCAFQNEGYEVMTAGTVKELERILDMDKDFSALILDCNLPDGDGFFVCHKLKQEGVLFPVVLLTARDMEDEMIQGFEAGADDYVTKPFFLEVFKLRINALIKRREQKNRISSHNIDLDLDQHKVLHMGKEISLTNLEYELLELLLKNKNRVLEHEVIWEAIWGTKEKYVDDTSISMLVSRLRSKLNKTGSGCYLKTMYGIGYFWEDK